MLDDHLIIVHKEPLEELFKLAHRDHFTLEDDPWFNCPLSPWGTANDALPKTCNCGADAHNALVDALRDRLGG